MKLITEHLDAIQYITEAKDNGEKDVFIEGIFMQAEQKNRNNRIYPKAVLEAACTKYIKEQVKTELMAVKSKSDADLKSSIRNLQNTRTRYVKERTDLETAITKIETDRVMKRI